MGILSKRLGFQALSLEDPSQPWLPYSALFESLGLGRSDAGVLVNTKQLLRITTAQACVRIISEDLASTAHEILQHMPDGSVRVARHHRLWPILHDEPNPNMSAMTFWGTVLAAALLHGPSFTWIKRDACRRVVALVPLDSGKTAPVKIKGKLEYGTTQTETGTVAYIQPEDVLHFGGLTLDGLTYVGPITCQNAFGLAMAAEKFGAQFFGNGAHASGVFSHPGVLEGEALQNLQKSLYERLTGENAQRPLILEEGMKWNQITIAPNDAQFLQTRQYQSVEIARLFRVPMHLLQDLQRATNNNIEHQSLDYVRYCLRPWAVRIEQEVNRKLLGGPFTMEHNLNDMQRGDFASQTAGIQILRNIGLYSTNDGLRKLRENPISAEEGGDIRIVQGAFVNLVALLDAGDDPQPAATADAPDASQPFDQIRPAYRGLLADAVRRICRAGKGPEFAMKLIHPIVSSMAQAMLALRFGNVDFTQKELALVNAETQRVVAESGSWDFNDASQVAVRVSGELFQALRKEIV